jgi:hypothetical protein
MVASVLVLTVASATALAQSPEPSEAETRVEVPEGGYEVTFPEFWQTFRTTAADASGLVETYGVSVAAAQWLEDQGKLGVLLVGRLDFGSQLCLIQSQPSDGSVADEADALAEAQSQSPSVTTDVSLTMHQWSVGEVAQLSFIRLRADGEEEFVGFWLFSDGATFHSITCHGQIMLGEEYWQSIAMSFEFLPGEGPVLDDRVGTGGRIERPADGYAIVFPDGWEAQELTDELHLTLWGEPPDDDETPYLFAQPPGSEGHCVLVDFAEYAMAPPAFVDVDEATNDEASEGDEVSFLETAAGRVGRVTGVNEDGGFNEIYLYRQDDRWIYLECWAPGPHDDFATIAESFEFLPAE